jgi:Uma2 family endonuclease
MLQRKYQDDSLARYGTPMVQRHNDDTIALHGIPMTEEAFERMIGVESPYRYELIDGVVYDMTGSTPQHSAVIENVGDLFREQLGNCGPCRIYRDQYVAIPDKPPVVPDVVLTCDLADWDKDKRLNPFKIQSPLIVVEVLSPSTARYDRTEKFARYRRCATLEVYMLVIRMSRSSRSIAKSVGGSRNSSQKGRRSGWSSLTWNFRWQQSMREFSNL